MVPAQNEANTADAAALDGMNGGRQSGKPNGRAMSPAKEPGQMRLTPSESEFATADMTATAGTSKADAILSVFTEQSNDKSARQDSIGTKNEGIMQVISSGVASSDDDETAEANNIGALWRTLFHDCFHDADSSACLIVDAIDECHQTEALALWAAVKDSMSAGAYEAPLRLQAMMFVQPDTVVSLVDVIGAEIVKLDGHHNREDLEQFVHHRMSAAWSGRLVQRGIYNRVQKAIVGWCDGNFLKASLVADEVTSLNRDDIVCGTIKSLPKDLKGAMLLILNRLSRQLDRHHVEDLRVRTFRHHLNNTLGCGTQDILSNCCYVRCSAKSNVAHCALPMHDSGSSNNTKQTATSTRGEHTIYLIQTMSIDNVAKPNDTCTVKCHTPYMLVEDEPCHKTVPHLVGRLKREQLSLAFASHVMTTWHVIIDDFEYNASESNRSIIITYGADVLPLQ